MVNQLVSEQIAPYGTLQISNENLLRVLVGEKGEHKIKKLLSQYQIFDDDATDETVNVLRIASLPFDELKQRGSLSDLETARILAGVELGIRIATAEKFSSKYMTQVSIPQNVSDLISPKMRFLDHEEFVVLLLNSKNIIIGCKCISKGSVTGTVVDSKAVFSYALSHKACTSIVCAHNHPSGDPMPSKEDIEITKLLVAGGLTLNLPVVDHLIIAQDGYFSFSEHNMLKL